MNDGAFKSDTSGNMNEQLLDVKQVAKMLGISTRSVYRLVARKKLPKQNTVDGLSSTRWHLADILAYIKRICGGSQ